MDLLDLLGQAAHHLFRAIIVAAPLLLWQGGLRLTRLARAGNGLADATVVAGAMIGLAALGLLLPPMALTWDAIMSPGGVWDLSLGGFMTRAARYVGRAVPGLVDGMVWGDERANVLAWCGVALLIWVMRVVTVIALRRANRLPRLLVSEVVVLGLTVHAIVYIGLLVLWAANQLNFWILLVLLLLLQDYRHNEPPVMRVVLNALSGGRNRRQPEEPVRVVD